MTDAGWIEFRAERDKEQRWQALYSFGEQGEQLTRSRIDPMCVLEDDEQRILPSRQFEVPQKRLECFPLLPMWGKVKARKALARKRQQVCQQSDIGLRRRVRARNATSFPLRISDLSSRSKAAARSNHVMIG